MENIFARAKITSVHYSFAREYEIYSGRMHELDFSERLWRRSAAPGYVFLVLTAICNEQQSDPWFIVAVTCMHYVDIPPRRAREREPFIAAE